MPCVVGKSRWNLQVKQGAVVNKIATVSDEAFTLLMLENYWDVMDEMDEDEFYKPLKHNSGKSSNESNSRSEKKTKKKTKVSSGKWTSAWRGSRRFCGWDAKGLLRFNELVKLVEDDRKDDVHFQTQYNINVRRLERNKSSERVPVAAATVPVYRDFASLGV